MPPVDLSESALLLIGHGSVKNPHSSEPTKRLGDALADTGAFAQASTAFFKEEPKIDTALDGIDAPQIYVVPNFAGAGYFTCEAIPEKLGLTGRYTILPDGREVTLCNPVGTHPRIAEIIAERAKEVVKANALDCADVCVILAGHGSTRPGGSSKSTEELATELSKRAPCGQIIPAFLEQEPYIKDWAALTDRRHVIVVPLLIAEGLHGSQDLPPLFGIDPAELENAGPILPPRAYDGRTIHYCRGIGGIPDLVDIVMELVAER